MGPHEIYYNAGWPTFPLPAGSKYPPPVGFTGRTGVDADLDQLRRWDERRDRLSRNGRLPGNLAIRMPVGVVGIDVDSYKPPQGLEWDAWIARYGELPATWRSSRRADGSGTAFLLDASGAALLSEASWGEVVQRHHRYSLVWPSAVDGMTYRWYRRDGSLAAEGEVPHV